MRRISFPGSEQVRRPHHAECVVALKTATVTAEIEHVASTAASRDDWRLHDLRFPSGAIADQLCALADDLQAVTRWPSCSDKCRQVEGIAARLLYEVTLTVLVFFTAFESIERSSRHTTGRNPRMGRPVAGSGHGDAARFTLFLGDAINEIAALIMGKFRYPVIVVWPGRTLQESRAGTSHLTRSRECKMENCSAYPDEVAVAQ